LTAAPSPDDHFPDETVVMIVRRERAEDIEPIRAVQHAAFQRSEAAAAPVEVTLIDALRRSTEWLPELSLVAERDGRVVGHVVCSRAWVGERQVVGLGPIGVRPDLQGEGIGHALMHAIVAAAEARDEPLIGLLGSTAFYPRFGFRASLDLGIVPPDPSWGDHFQVRPLAAYSNDFVGTFKYAAPFDEV
jgi:putative acetyltransferase